MGDARSVLVVEDEPDFLDAVAHTLRRRGYAVETAADAAGAAARLAAGLPDLLLVDMLLPGASGFQVVRRVEEASDGRVPVIMMSGVSSAAHRDFALAAGVDVFLPKPFALARLVAAVKALCPPPRPAPARPPAPPAAVAP